MSQLCGGPVKGLLCDITGVLRESSSTDDGTPIPVSFTSKYDTNELKL